MHPCTVYSLILPILPSSVYSLILPIHSSSVFLPSFHSILAQFIFLIFQCILAQCILSFFQSILAQCIVDIFTNVYILHRWLSHWCLHSTFYYSLDYPCKQLVWCPQLGFPPKFRVMVNEWKWSRIFSHFHNGKGFAIPELYGSISERLFYL